MSVVLIGGGTGFIGKHLSRHLTDHGHTVRHLSRSPRPDSPYKTFHWDAQKQTIDEAAFAGTDYVINLAGAGIVDKRWTEERKQVIIRSRTQTTGLLAAAFARLDYKPKRYLSASAIGYYGNRPGETMIETSKPGDGFLSKSCILWEESVQEIKRLGVPIFIARTGIVLHPDEGALQKMLLPMNVRVSTYFGDGSQVYSWIHINDMIDIYRAAIDADLDGVFNAVAPNAATNKELAEAIPRAMDKKALVVPTPAPVMRLAMGEMSHTVLDGARCSAQKLLDHGFDFDHPTLDGALTDLLSKK